MEITTWPLSQDFLYFALKTCRVEHIDKANQKAADSFINNHQVEAHEGDQPSFSVKVLKSFKDPLSRQVYEGVYIRSSGENSLNTKMDYYQTSTYRMRREILHGWLDWCKNHVLKMLSLFNLNFNSYFYQQPKNILQFDKGKSQNMLFI